MPSIEEFAQEKHGEHSHVDEDRPYEYEGGSFPNLESLTWTERLQITITTARKLSDLHDGDAPDQYVIVHRGIKTASILLDEKWEAQLSDFAGLSIKGIKGPANVESSFAISKTFGTLGYVDPEYLYTRRPTKENDVYSFGVILFETLCGVLASERTDGQFFSALVQEHYISETLDEIIPSDLYEQINPASLLTFTDVAYRCLKNAESRPTAKEVLEQLEKALDNQLVAASGSWSGENSVFTAADDDGYVLTAPTTTTWSSKSSPNSRKHDVFISYRGPDTRENFVKQLSSALLQQRVYKDDLIPRGESIGPSLFKAIRESKMAIIVFSENFADSDWCLNENAYIMKCRAERGLIVIPIFYHVDPSEVRKQKGKYGAAFLKHELENIDKVRSWRKALEDAANIAGFVVTGDEERAIDEIVYTITYTYLGLIPCHKATDETSAHINLIGIEARLQDFRPLLLRQSSGVRMVGICGTQGSGKSALASSIYDEIRNEFEGCCFVQNVCAESRMHGLKTLQEKILSDVFKSKVILSDVTQGVSMMTRRLCHNSVLIVLDDVSHVVHLNMLAGSTKWFGNGSLIIVVTRNQDLVRDHNFVTHNVRMLDAKEAIKLFSRHAFGAERPAEGYVELSNNIVSKLGGHPLALKSLGSILHDKDIIKWKSALTRLEDIPLQEILQKFGTGDDGVSRNNFSWFAT